MRRRTSFLVLAVPSLLAVSVAWGQTAPTLTARAELRRRYLWIGADGTVPAVS